MSRFGLIDGLLEYIIEERLLLDLLLILFIEIVVDSGV